MKRFEKSISPLIRGMFPSIYKEEGENFIAFVEAYYEWLETNHQLLTLESVSNFNVNDTVTQGNNTGTVVVIDGNEILVRVSDMNVFTCNIGCDSYQLIESSSGGLTFITEQKKISPLYYSRRLSQIGDIDETIDSFVIRYKEKYLRNIDFDIASNKQLLIKNSLDLYRSKGTERSIDLFFRLVYGTSADVFYPGDSLMSLSAAEYSKPQYLEITYSPLSVDLVGKQIEGVSSGATAFVERYVKRRVGTGFVYMFFISNVNGTFQKNELLKAENFFSGLPKVVGSLTGLTVVSPSSGFTVGDIVDIVIPNGRNGKARVAALNAVTGVVEFDLIEGGYGYTTSSNTSLSSSELEDRTQTIVSNTVLTLANVTLSNTVASIAVTNGGSGYNNSDVITVSSIFVPARARPVTNSTGGIEYLTITEKGSGFYVNSPSATIANSTGGASGGTGANLVVTTEYNTSPFKIFETATTPLFDVVYDTASNNQLLTSGSEVRIGNSSTNVAFGVIVSNANGALADANGVLSISIANNGSFGTSNTIYLVSNSSITANVASITDDSVTGTLMGSSQSPTVGFTSLTGSFVAGDQLEMKDSSNTTVGAAIVSKTRQSLLELTSASGIIPVGATINNTTRLGSATVADVAYQVGVYNVAGGLFSNTSTPQIWFNKTGTTGHLQEIGSGSGATFRVDTIGDPETVLINTDLLSANNGNNIPWLNVSINTSQYDFPKNPGANLADPIYSCLSWDQLTIGSVSSLSRINQGINYDTSPFVLLQQPYVSNRHDYIITIANTTGSFTSNERLLQTATTVNVVAVELVDETGFELGGKVLQGSANGVIDSINTTANTINLVDVQGTFAVNSTPVELASNTSVSSNVVSTSSSNTTIQARGIVKSANSTVLRVKRLQYENRWQEGATITGQRGGAQAVIVSVDEDVEGLPIGLNANIQSNTISSDSSVASLEVVESGIGYNDNQLVFFVSQDGERSGTAVANAQTTGIGAGSYRSFKGFLSSDRGYLQDGDYWHEYSYDILSRISIDRYRDMFKEAMHVAGTRFFGRPVFVNTTPAQPTIKTSSVTTINTP